MDRRFVLGLLLLSSALAGCGPGNEIDKVVVSGKVTRDGGVPMVKGRITLFPLKGTKGPVSGAEIRMGEYKIDSKGGVPVGKHLVQFHEFAVDPNRDPTLPPPLVENNILPENFNEKSKLELDVPAGDPIVRDFDLDEEFGPAEPEEPAEGAAAQP